MKSILISFVFSLIAGSLYALSYPSFLGDGWFPLLFIALPLHLYSLRRLDSLRYYLLAILAFNLGLNLTGYYWIPHTLQEFGELPYFLSLIISLFFTFILQPHWWVYALWLKWRPNFQWGSSFGLFLSAVILSLLERFVQQQFPSFVGSPWLHLAPYIGLAPVFGVIIFSFFTYWISLEIVEQMRDRRLYYFPWIAFVVFILINTLTPIKAPESNQTLRVRIVQANVGNFLKVSSERGDENSLSSIIESYLDLSTANPEFKPDLIIWPETAYPNEFAKDQKYLPKIFNDIMEETNAEILIGGYVRNPDYTSFEQIYNSSLLFSNNELKSSYYKNILIPFGETLPFGPLNQSIVQMVPAIALFARGEGTEKMETRNGARFVTPICYEILESEFMRKLLNEYGNNQFIVNHSNDSWYGVTAEPYQHLFLSKWRALEFAIPIIRSTNTGVTSVIYPDGSESKRLLIGEKKALEEVIPLPPAQNTIYQRYGVIPFLLVTLLMGLVIWWQERN